ncbi:sensor histidine kinase [Pseudoalteromonas ulvae]|uniref:histidine kinase n=1 Tax=Pseudoalteromonas ulvae TaxID=107327 RepID=A0A244CL64_PSEDV|nr:HAMP domain-containing sensor histidine kinase [Pseudoalteromonas ulvae]OUL56357.1 hypothetical protein B1199_16910 [Pseudoalteromonas ulvae]
MKLRHSLNVSQILSVLTLVIFLTCAFLLYRNDSHTALIHQQLLNLQKAMYQVTSLDTEFINDPDTKSIEQHFQTYLQAKILLSDSLTKTQTSILLLEQLDSSVKEYQKTLYKIVDLQREIGFNEDLGLRAKFRHAVHALQTYSQNLDDKNFEILILEIRRREKDYLLRIDEQYLTLHKTLVNQAKSYHQQHQKSITLLDDYQQALEQYLMLRKEQGLNKNSGLIGQNSLTKKSIEEQTASLSKMINHTLEQYAFNTLMTALILLFIVITCKIIISSLLHRRIAQSFFKMNSLLAKITAENNFILRSDLTGDDELSEFSNHLNELISHVEELLTKLKKAQDRLVEDAKMASLGTMVNGFAHELNTPLGIVITSESHLRHKLHNLKHLLAQGTLKKEHLDNLINEADMGLNLMESNLARCASLITNFKQIAVHQQYDELVEFNLLDQIKSVFQTYNHELNKHSVTFELNIPDNLLLRSYVGAFNQIIGMLINNSLKHGLVPDKTLHIEVLVKLVSGALHFRFSDNGIGIEEEMLKKVFDPFVTTKRGSGGTGLGLSIIYSLITQKLKGELELQSVAGEGIVFYMHLANIDYRYFFENN